MAIQAKPPVSKETRVVAPDPNLEQSKISEQQKTSTEKAEGEQRGRLKEGVEKSQIPSVPLSKPEEKIEEISKEVPGPIAEAKPQETTIKTEPQRVKQPVAIEKAEEGKGFWDKIGLGGVFGKKKGVTEPGEEPDKKNVEHADVVSKEGIDTEEGKKAAEALEETTATTEQSPEKKE